MTYYEALIKLAQSNYNKIHIDLAHKTLKVGKQVVIECGNIKHDKIIVGDDVYECIELIAEPLNIDELYKMYKYSLPSERDGVKHYFKALPASLLTDEQMITGMPRLEARVRLEAYVMFAALKGWLELEHPEHWYWQSKQDRDFVILKKYI